MLKCSFVRMKFLEKQHQSQEVVILKVKYISLKKKNPKPTKLKKRSKKIKNPKQNQPTKNQQQQKKKIQQKLRSPKNPYSQNPSHLTGNLFELLGVSQDCVVTSKQNNNLTTRSCPFKV